MTFPFVDCFNIMLNTWMQRLTLPSSRDDGDDDDTTSGAQIEELPSESVNTFREDGEYVCVCVLKRSVNYLYQRAWYKSAFAF